MNNNYAMVKKNPVTIANHLISKTLIKPIVRFVFPFKAIATLAMVTREKIRLKYKKSVKLPSSSPCTVFLTFFSTVFRQDWFSVQCLKNYYALFPSSCFKHLGKETSMQRGGALPQR